MSETTSPRILIWDIENSPNLGWIWSKWQTDVISFEQDWFMLSAAWGWYDESEIQVKGLDDFQDYKPGSTTDRNLVELARDLFDQADVVVAHNGVRYDTKKLQTRIAVHGLEPPSPFVEVDTLKIAKAKFAFTSNSLNDLCQFLGIGKKTPVGGFDTWEGCMRGDAKAWKLMKAYNKHDVVLLKDLYRRFQPWAPKSGAPNFATISGNRRACPRCGVQGKMIIRGYSHTGVSRAARMQCTSCGGYSRTRVLDRMEPTYVPA